ncbi:M3 family oligoendopeptidase [Thermodesulfobacteriota bacterium]
MTRGINETLGTENVLWNLADLYQGTDDQAITQDIQFCEEEAAAINASFSTKVASLDQQELSSLVTRLEHLETVLGRIATFAFLNFTTRIKDSEAGAFLQKTREVISRIGKETVFFELEWSKVDADQATQLVSTDILKHYSHYLESLRRYADHHLSKIEETLLLERAPVGRSSWTNLFDKVIGHIAFGEKKRTEEEVLSELYSPDRTTRQQAAAELTAGLSDQLHILTHIFNTLLADKMIDDRLRSYPSWVSSMNLYNELPDDTVDVLVECVTKRYDIPQRYYRIKRELLGLDELMDFDRYAPLPHLNGSPEDATDNGLIPWGECQRTVLNAFGAFSPQMADIAQYFFDKQWIHAPILEGKRGGAFAHPCIPAVHPYIMVNYTGNLRDVSTVAHELGHGIHQYLAADLGYYNSNTPLVLAETASVFGELLVFHAQLATIADPQKKKAYICQKLESIFATVFRQVTMNRFEHFIHNNRRKGKELSTEDISKSWIDTQRNMFGDSVLLTDDYAIWWSYIPHFLSTPGYVYSYAFGELLVLALYKIYQEEKEAFVPKYIELLRAGGSRSPASLVEPFGISLDDPDFWMGGLDIINDLLNSIAE